MTSCFSTVGSATTRLQTGVETTGGGVTMDTITLIKSLCDSEFGLPRDPVTPQQRLPAAAAVATQNDLRTGAAHGAVRLVAIFIVTVQRLCEVLLQNSEMAFLQHLEYYGQLSF